MHAMQYEITLPADYDMTIIEQRVATRGCLLDNFDGLGLKTYTVRRRGLGGSSVNQYAPFYLWRSIDAMNEFILGTGFRGLCDTFGRPSVQHWIGISFDPGQAFHATPRTAARTVQRLGPDDDVSAAVGEQRLAPADLRHPDLHSTALLLDVRTWELARFSLWTAAPATPGTYYEVLHLSAPELAALAG